MVGAGSLVSAGVGLVSGTFGMFQGAKQERELERALENFNRQDLNNVADDLSVYTKGAEFQLQESARQGASSIDALQRGGSRNLIGGVGKVQQEQQGQSRQITADLERQQALIDQIRANDEARIRQMQENRDIQDIQALSLGYQQGQSQFNAGIGNIAGAGIGLGNTIENDRLLKDYGYLNVKRTDK